MAAERIFLIGMMGSGKSHWLKQMAKWNKSVGYDLDALIEMNEEKTIAEIFNEDGEVYFRIVESKILRWFKEKKKYVVATGGGTACTQENMDWMKKFMDLLAEDVKNGKIGEYPNLPELQVAIPEEVNDYYITQEFNIEDLDPSSEEYKNIKMCDDTRKELKQRITELEK